MPAPSTVLQRIWYTGTNYIGDRSKKIRLTLCNCCTSHFRNRTLAILGTMINVFALAGLLYGIDLAGKTGRSKKCTKTRKSNNLLMKVNFKVLTNVQIKNLFNLFYFILDGLRFQIGEELNLKCLIRAEIIFCIFFTNVL